MRKQNVTFNKGNTEYLAEQHYITIGLLVLLGWFRLDVCHCSVLIKGRVNANRVLSESTLALVCIIGSAVSRVPYAPSLDSFTDDKVEVALTSCTQRSPQSVLRCAQHFTIMDLYLNVKDFGRLFAAGNWTSRGGLLPIYIDVVLEKSIFACSVLPQQPGRLGEGSEN